MSEIGEPIRRIVVIPAVPEQQPVPAPREPVKVPEKEPA
jgi:hypothetical protein